MKPLLHSYRGVFTPASTLSIGEGRIIPPREVIGASMFFRATPTVVHVSKIYRSDYSIVLELSGENNGVIGTCTLDVSQKRCVGVVTSTIGEVCGSIIGTETMWTILKTMQLPVELSEDALVFCTECIHFLPEATVKGRLTYQGQPIRKIEWNTDKHITINTGVATIVGESNNTEPTGQTINTIIVNGAAVTDAKQMYITSVAAESGIRLGMIDNGITIGRSLAL